ncbi:ABC transporter permease [Natronobacterium texcoconense]|uniref:Putative ABC transport system permease protein n=1 Tax=Natronobacterium texcoconense TaxID=1095778 RepID=A0A1H1IXH3_NATTX|nr:FtsX-like permease family protein [Natronobacterium texcoconense]SDR41978.1 putative ABC transport system permease protein [Natronobacterium texcoconense]
MGTDGDGSRRSRWAGVVSLSVGRLWKRATRTRSGRIAAMTAAVALTIALLLIVTGMALALADGGVTNEDDADVTVAPEGSGTISTVDGVEGPRLGETNERTETIREDDGVDHASPVLVERVRLESAGDDGEPRTILVVGVVPDDENRTVAGLSTGGLEPGDPHYADGAYDGPREREIVLSSSAAERLEATSGDDLAVSGLESAGGDEVPTPTVQVTAVEDGPEESEAPVALVHLSELQDVSGAADGELADHVLVWGDEEAATAAASEEYPDAAIETDDATDPSALFDDGLAFATSLLALIVGLTICTSFVATTAGMTVDEDRRTLAVLESIGFPTSSRLAVVGLSTIVTTVCGALLGAALGIAGIELLDAVVTSDTIAQAHPLFVPYAVAVGLVSGAVAVPYPMAIAARTSVLEEVGR